MKPIKIENEKELLSQLRENNCREILTCDVNIRVAERSKDAGSPELGAIQNFITKQKQRRDELIAGVYVIDDRINEL